MSGSMADDDVFSVDVTIEADGWRRVGDMERISAETLRAALRHVDVPATSLEVSVALMDDAAVRELNRRFRGFDKPTNVLSFPADQDYTPPGAPVALGDIAVAYETVIAEAAAQGKDPDAHFRHLLVHGFLHLLGYDHQEDDAAEDMERLEAAILGSLGLPDPYEVDNGNRQAVQ